MNAFKEDEVKGDGVVYVYYIIGETRVDDNARYLNAQRNEIAVEKTERLRWRLYRSASTTRARYSS